MRQSDSPIALLLESRREDDKQDLLTIQWAYQFQILRNAQRRRLCLFQPQ